MLEPQSTTLFVLLIVMFGALIWRSLAARRTAFRILAAGLAFVPAMTFGVLAVNRYYDYYQTWDALIADLTNQGVPAAAQVPEVRYAAGALDGSRGRLLQAQQQGYLLRMMVTGQRSHLTRVVYVWLPPQYFEPAYRAYRFPVIELIHGQPGEPQDWITVVGVTRTLDQLLAGRLARPAVLVMPDANGGRDISLQCLDQAGGPQDLTYLALDLPAQITRMLRVARPGPAWAVAGYSEGGFCAANMALRYPARYGAAGVLSGYFTPDDNQLADPSRTVSPFAGSARLQAQNTRDLGEQGWVIVSGGAYGIDAAAHRGALATGAITIAILACGVDHPYPAGHADLFGQIAAHGLVVSEWPPGRRPARQRFLVRNRTIAALTCGTVIVEAGERSGALNTARHAAELGRPLMAVPGPVTSAQSAGCHQIIREWGATCVTRAADIIEMLSPVGVPDTLAPADGRGPPLGLGSQSAGSAPSRDDLDADSARVLDALPARGGAGTSTIAVEAGVDLDTVLRCLGLLTGYGFIERCDGGWRLRRVI